MARSRLFFFSLLCCSLLLGCNAGSPPDTSTEVALRGILSSAISNDGQYAVIGSVDHGGSLWRLADGERLYDWNHKQGELTTLVAADFSTDGQWAITSDPNTLVLWNLKEGSAFRYWIAPAEVLDVALSQNGNLALLGTSGRAAVVFDVVRGGIKRNFNHDNRVRSVALSDDGRLALTGSEDTTAVLWDMASGKALQRIQHNDEVQLVELSPDGSLALSASKYDKAIVWHTNDGTLVGEIPLAANKLKRGLRFTAAAFSADNRYLLTGRPDQMVQLWDMTSMSLVKEWRVPKRDSWRPTGAAITSVGFTGSDQFLAVASNGFVHLLSR